MATSDDPRLARARMAIIAGLAAGACLVALSVFVLFRADVPDDSEVTVLLDRELSDPSIVPTPTPTPPEPTPTPFELTTQPRVTTRQIAVPGDWAEAPAVSDSWIPAIINAAAVVDLTIINEVTDFGRETFAYADDAQGMRLVAGGQEATERVRAGEVMLVQNTPSGWPDPKVICDGGNPTVMGSRVFLTMAIGPEVLCVFRNTPDADSLGVRDTTVTCRGIEGDARGPAGPFYLRYVLTPIGDASTPTLEQNGIGAVVVESPGPFIAEFDQSSMPESGEYQLGYFVRDQTGSQIGALDVSSINFDNYPCDPDPEAEAEQAAAQVDPQVALRLQPAAVAGLPARSTDWIRSARLVLSESGSVERRSVEYRNEIEGDAGEVFLFADSVENVGIPLGPGDVMSTTTQQDRVRIVLHAPSGWPDPEMSCERGFVETVASRLEVDMRAVPAQGLSFAEVRCVFRSVPDADSLRVTDLLLDCDGLSGTMHGLDGRFYVTFELEPLDRVDDIVPLGTFRIDETGRFIAPRLRFESQPEPGLYLVDLTIWDSFDSELHMLDTATVRQPECS